MLIDIPPILGWGKALFHHRARAARAAIAVGERRLYAKVIVRKGLIHPVPEA